MRKLIFYIVSAVLWFACFALVIVVWLEYLGGYDVAKRLLRNKPPVLLIHHSSYFGKPLAINPYRQASIQYLHPF